MTSILVKPLRKMNDETFFKFCQKNRDYRIERDIKGNIVFMASAGSDTGFYNLSLAAQVSLWNHKSKLGFAFDSSAGFTFPDGAVRSPDVTWILKERYLALPMSDRQKFAHIVPDFVIELRSPSDNLKELKEKMQAYLENGVRLGFLIDRVSQTSFIYRPRHEVEIIKGFNQYLSGEAILPNFELDLSVLL